RAGGAGAGAAGDRVDLPRRGGRHGHPAVGQCDVAGRNLLPPLLAADTADEAVRAGGAGELRLSPDELVVALCRHAALAVRQAETPQLGAHQARWLLAAGSRAGAAAGGDDGRSLASQDPEMKHRNPYMTDGLFPIALRVQGMRPLLL